MTALLTRLVTRVVDIRHRPGVGTAYFTVEMRDQEIMDQALTRLSGVEFERYLHGRLNDAEIDAVHSASEVLAKLPLFVREVRRIVELARANDFSAASRVHRRMYPAFRTLFIEPNPVPIKYALKRAGIIAGDAVRAPLCEMTAGNRARLEAVLAALD